MAGARRKAAVIGAGSWGTTVAMLLAKHHAATLWCRDESTALEFEKARSNTRYLPNLSFPDALKVTSELGVALEGADLVFLAVPSHGFRVIVQKIAGCGVLDPGVSLISLAKGMEATSDMFMTEILSELCPKNPCGVLSGPNLAREVAAGQPAACIVESRDEKVTHLVQEALHSDWFRVYSGSDVIGCEVAGVSKNVFAIAAGLSDGLGFGDNTRAMLITRGLAEMGRLGVTLGGQTLTFGGLAGIGDLVATSTSENSRNRSVGFRLGMGETLDSILSSTQMVAEGVKSSSPLLELAIKADVECPICEQVAAIVAGTATPKEAMESLMRRPARSEWDPVLKKGLL